MKFLKNPKNFLILAVLFLGLYLLLKPQLSLFQEKVQTYKTYSGKGLGISFKYPSFCNLTEGKSTSFGSNVLYQVVVSSEDCPTIFFYKFNRLTDEQKSPKGGTIVILKGGLKVTRVSVPSGYQMANEETVFNKGDFSYRIHMLYEDAKLREVDLKAAEKGEAYYGLSVSEQKKKVEKLIRANERAVDNFNLIISSIE